MNKTNNIRIALFEPRIPQNTGNIVRTAAAYNYTLDLIKPLGFSLEDKYLKRAGLDYWRYLQINVHENFDRFYSTLDDSRLIAFSKFSKKPIYNFKLLKSDVLLFGREDNGLTEYVKNSCTDILNIPMPGSADINDNNGVRSLNLSVACGIVAYKSFIDISNIV